MTEFWLRIGDEFYDKQDRRNIISFEHAVFLGPFLVSTTKRTPRLYAEDRSGLRYEGIDGIVNAPGRVPD
jgi:hypothetical protein